MSTKDELITRGSVQGDSQTSSRNLMDRKLASSIIPQIGSIYQVIDTLFLFLNFYQ